MIGSLFHGPSLPATRPFLFVKDAHLSYDLPHEEISLTAIETPCL